MGREEEARKQYNKIRGELGLSPLEDGAFEPCTRCNGSGKQIPLDLGHDICICGGTGTRFAQLVGELQEYRNRGY